MLALGPRTAFSVHRWEARSRRGSLLRLSSFRDEAGAGNDDLAVLLGQRVGGSRGAPGAFARGIGEERALARALGDEIVCSDAEESHALAAETDLGAPERTRGGEDLLAERRRHRKCRRPRERLEIARPHLDLHRPRLEPVAAERAGDAFRTLEEHGLDLLGIA